MLRAGIKCVSIQQTVPGPGLSRTGRRQGDREDGRGKEGDQIQKEGAIRPRTLERESEVHQRGKRDGERERHGRGVRGARGERDERRDPRIRGGRRVCVSLVVT